MNLTPPNSVDYLIFCYLMWCYFFGRYHRIGQEVKSFINTFVFSAVLWGFSFFDYIKQWVFQILKAGLSGHPMIIWILGFSLSLFLLFRIKKRLAAYLEQRLSENKNIATAGQLGLMRGFIFSISVLYFIWHKSWFDRITAHIESSWLGHLLIQINYHAF